MYINPYFFPNDEFMDQLINYNNANNSLFIATNQANNSCFSLLGVQIGYHVGKEYKLKLDYLYDGPKEYVIKDREIGFHYFTKTPKKAKILGTIQVGDTTYPNFIALSRSDDQSTIFLHCNPELYSNYHLLQKEDALYSLNSLSYLEQTSQIIWDGYGTRRRYTTPPSDGDTEGLLRYIRKNSSLFAAFIILLSCMVFFVLFNYKRMTRSLPVHVPQENNSIAFMQMVANLFVSEENHIHLAKYRVNYLLDRIKEKYHLDISNIDDDFQNSLAIKTSMNPPDLDRLMNLVRKIKKTNYLNKANFINFNKTLESYITRLDI